MMNMKNVSDTQPPYKCLERQFLDRVIKNRRLGPADIRVAIVCLMLGDDRGIVDIPIEALMRETRMGWRAIYRALNNLETLNLVKRLAARGSLRQIVLS
jgi:hypothetical protein